MTRTWPVIAAAAMLLFAAPSSARAEQFKPVLATDACEEVSAFVEVPLRNVEPFLPQEPTRSGRRYVPAAPDREAGLASVFIDALQCSEISVGPRTGPMRYATVSISIDAPEGSTSSLGGSSPGPNFYLVSWATDNPDFSDWLRDRTGLKARVALVRNLSYEHSPVDPIFRFSAPPPSPTPFELSAAVTEQVVPVPVIANYWRETSEGAVRIETSHLPDPSVNALGLSGGRVESTDPQSELAELFDPLATQPFLNGLTSAFPGAQWAKQVFPPVKE